MNIRNEEKIVKIRHLLMKKLDLVNNLNKDEFLDFCNKFTGFLRQNRYNSLLGNSLEVLEKKFNKTISFLKRIGFNTRDIIDILFKDFRLLSIIPEEEFINKYVLLSVLEDDKNSVRKHILEKTPRFFNKSLDELYARYKLLEESGYGVTKYLMTKPNYNEFINYFVARSFVRKPYQIFSEPISITKLISKYPIDYNFINELKKNDNNRNFLYDSEYLSKEEKIDLAIENYSKVNNLEELSKLLGISTSSLQRYLQDESSKYVSKRKYIEIKRWLNDAKINGNINGGIKSQKEYGYSKDNLGHFKGSGK